MPIVTDARNVDALQGESILFDTNIWLYLEGPSFALAGSEQNIYSAAYKKLRSANKIIINQYVIAEFCNRFVKIEYETFAAEHKNSGSIAKFPSLKIWRKTAEGLETLNSAHDTCYHFLDECEYRSVSCDRDACNEALAVFKNGTYDFTDGILRRHAAEMGHAIMTHDMDFFECGVHLITANKKLLNASNS